MSISQPSSEIYVVDVPEIKQFQAIYHYNFFVPDESVNETGGVPIEALTRTGSEIDSNFIQWSVTRVPRFVEFRWLTSRLADIGNLLSEKAIRDNVFQTTGNQYGSLILDNIDKIVSEDHFASNNYASINFHDGDIDKKIYELVSGTMVQQTFNVEHDGNASHYKAAMKLVPLLPSFIKPHFVLKALTVPKLAFSAQLYTTTATTAGSAVRGGMTLPSNALRVIDDYFTRLKSVNINTQINTKFLHDLVNKTIFDPTASQSADLVSMHAYSKQAQQSSNQRFSSALSAQSFKTFVPYVSIKQNSSLSHTEKYAAEIVGYIIDKLEVLPDGTTKEHAPIVIDSAHVGLAADYQIKFNANYCYTIRCIACLTLAAIDDDTGKLATIKVLVSSKPSNKIYVSTLKLDAPPPPGDVSFVWNYQVDDDLNDQLRRLRGTPEGLTVTWAFPVTSERDIKQFQVFRRSSINEPFELQKVYNFDDSVVPFQPCELPDMSLSERLSDPCTFWRDNEFDWNVNTSREKAFIYAVCAIDAHQLTSNYSAQFRVWFDRFKNKLQKEIVSHLGAPKPYPNMYLNCDLFANTIRVAGSHSKRLKIYFNPEYYYLYDDQDRYTKVLQTKQTGGSYSLQFINVDNMKSQNIDISIDDQMTISSKILASPIVRFGRKRKIQPSQT